MKKLFESILKITPFGLRERIDSLEKRSSDDHKIISERLLAIEKRLDGRIDRLEDKMDANQSQIIGHLLDIKSGR